MSWQKLHGLYQMPRQAPLNLQPRWNGAPTRDFAACRLDAQDARVLTKLRWGLIPAWAQDVNIGARLINARAEKPDGGTDGDGTAPVMPPDGKGDETEKPPSEPPRPLRFFAQFDVEPERAGLEVASTSLTRMADTYSR